MPATTSRKPRVDNRKERTRIWRDVARGLCGKKLKENSLKRHEDAMHCGEHLPAFNVA
jgi:siroheme synthase (precorrin-2 oxidase/ferrochelatase)